MYNHLNVAPEQPDPPIPVPLLGKTPSDKDLVEAAQRGDTKARGQLVSRYSAWVFQLCLRLSKRDPHRAQDAAQNAWLDVCKQLNQFRGNCSFKTWLFRLVYSACNPRRNDAAGVPGRGMVSKQTIRMPQGFDRSDRADLLEQVAIRELLALLPDGQREALVLHVQGYERAEIASMLEISPGAVGTRIRHARMTLGQHLGGN